MDLQFPPFWIKFSNYEHQCPPTWNALAVDAFILVTQPGAFNFKIDLALTNRAVTAITFSPQYFPRSPDLIARAPCARAAFQPGYNSMFYAIRHSFRDQAELREMRAA